MLWSVHNTPSLAVLHSHAPALLKRELEMEYLTNVYKCLTRNSQGDVDSSFQWPNNRTSGNAHKQEHTRFHTNIRKNSLLWGLQSNRTGYSDMESSLEKFKNSLDTSKQSSIPKQVISLLNWLLNCYINYWKDIVHP